MQSEDLTREQFQKTAKYLAKIAGDLLRLEDRLERKSFPRSDFLLDGVKTLRESVEKLSAECDYRSITAK